MTGNHQTSQNIEAAVTDPKLIFTFFVADMMFGLDVEQVLMLDQDMTEIQRLPVEEKGFKGITKFQGSVVPVFDFAHRIGIQSGIDLKQAILSNLAKFEQDYIDNLSSPEQVLKITTHSNFQADFKSCELAQWAANLETRDETLRELLDEFEQPHGLIHELMDQVVALHQRGKSDTALETLCRERMALLSRLANLFSRVREQVESAVRQVLLFVTTDGKTPLYALVIDELNDVLHYEASDFHASDIGPLRQIVKMDEVIGGIFTKADMPDCIYFDVQKLVDTEQLNVISE